MNGANMRRFRKMRMTRMVVGAIATNCYIVSDENTKKAFIVDPGGDADRIKQKVEELELKVGAILLTHGHFDHVMAVDTLRDCFGAKVYLGEEEKVLIENAQQNVSAMFGKPMTTTADVFVKDGEILNIAGFDIQVLATPGHTKGGVCYYLKAQDVAFSGDTIFQCSVGRTDFPGGSQSQLSRSIREKLFVLPDDTQLFPGHGDSTVVSYEKKYNPFV